jgi:hypothetical protein
VLAVEPHRPVAVLEGTRRGERASARGGDLRERAERTTTRAREVRRAHVDLGLREVPSDDGVGDDVVQVADAVGRRDRGRVEATRSVNVVVGGANGDADAEAVERDTARDTTAFLQVRLRDGESLTEALTLLAEGSREDAVHAVGERSRRGEEEGRPERLLAEAEDILGQLERDRGNPSLSAADHGDSGNAVHDVQSFEIRRSR